ncbi:uncharacterized protein [Prorops nasuta]|uniref:uncharacterized protein n=1 Tax=Prorops nasuta TaxID=863751 RepID=UPI0034CF3FC8
MSFCSEKTLRRSDWSTINVLYIFWCFSSSSFAKPTETGDNRPYEFSFNIADFQHRFEKKDVEGIITGEYGFITADGIYHETGYATSKEGDFIITKMRNRRITSLKDAQEIFKDNPEKAQKLVEAVAKTCASCKLLAKEMEKPKEIPKPPLEQIKMQPVFKETKNLVTEKTKIETPKRKEELGRKANNEKLSKEDNDRSGKALLAEEARGKTANNLRYQFNYTISTHEHQEDGYRDGRKDGSYRSQNENGLDTHVEYLSNEFGHQPNVTFVSNSKVSEEHELKGYSFLWFLK